MKTLNIIKAGREALFTQAVEPFSIAIHPWPDSGYSPATQCRLCYDDKGLHIGFTVWEDRVVINHFEKNEAVSQDSCVEFFVSPEPEGSLHYTNFEMNAIGVFLAKHRPNPGEFEFIERSADDGEFDIRSTLSKDNYTAYTGPYWQVSYTVPAAVFTKYFPGCRLKAGAVWRANFYKCGHGGFLRHQMAWNNIETERPQFHSPQFFGKIIFG